MGKTRVGWGWTKIHIWELLWCNHTTEFSLLNLKCAIVKKVDDTFDVFSMMHSLF